MDKLESCELVNLCQVLTGTSAAKCRNTEEKDCQLQSWEHEQRQPFSGGCVGQSSSQKSIDLKPVPRSPPVSKPGQKPCCSDERVG